MDKQQDYRCNWRVTMEIFGNIIVSIITASLTFIITRYEIYKKRPTDKLEISYNKFYYPALVWGEKLNFTCTAYDNYVSQVKTRIKAYDKYVTGETKKLFSKLEESLIDHKDTVAAYEKFYKDIKHNNQKLRSEIGYIEPNYIEKFIAKSTTEKFSTVLPIIYIAYALFTYASVVYFGMNNRVTLYFVGIGAVILFILAIIFTVVAIIELINDIKIFIRRKKVVRRVRKKDLYKYK